MNRRPAPAEGARGTPPAAGRRGPWVRFSRPGRCPRHRPSLATLTGRAVQLELVPLPEAGAPGALPMFGQGCVGVVVEGLDEEEGVVDEGLVEEGIVVEVLLLVAALAAAKPMPMLSPISPPARARVVSDFLSVMFVLSGSRAG